MIGLFKLPFEINNIYRRLKQILSKIVGPHSIETWVDVIDL